MIMCADAVSRDEILKRYDCVDPDGTFISISSLIDYIKNMPPVMPEQKTGRWEGTNEAKCNMCGHVYPLFIRFQNYCPNCGAKMEA